ncbi:Interferon-induced protein 44 [Bagarius yarrelli]|uniref:Interferon-induced protein 44 n=1 Tax=Bagarius yarrelli TaxID=175774 RepID=A0A556TZD1_BAGYA|nr:Interferon-induced protein 44 [Bagarius yarrelli]
MASIGSSLRDEDEVRLQEFFSRRVRFHLLYKSSHHGAGIDQLLERFDLHGKYLLTVFLESVSIRGAFISESLLHGKSFSDKEAFVFTMSSYSGERFPRGCYKRDPFPVSVGSDFISIGKGLNLQLLNGSWYVTFSKHVFYNGTVSDNNVCCKDVELHRVQDVNDILPNPWREALLLGPVGSGKSSFINSVRSTMYNRFVHLPNIGTAVEGFTQKMTTYNIRVKERGCLGVLSLCDVMALGDDDSSGLSHDDALAVIKGHVPDGYKFQKGVTISDTVKGYIADPTLTDQIHCVLFVLDASKMASYSSSLEAMLKKLHAAISDLGIPQLVLLTHVDRVCLGVQKDVKDVYYSQAVQEKMQKAATMVGLPLSYILPVKNYFSTLTVDCNTDILLLSVVMSILQAVDDSLEDQYTSSFVSSTPVIDFGHLGI